MNTILCLFKKIHQCHPQLLLMVSHENGFHTTKTLHKGLAVSILFYQGGQCVKLDVDMEIEGKSG